MARDRLRRAAGFTLLEVLIALGVLAVALGLLSQWTTEAANDIRDQAAATFHHEITEAAHRYVTDNFATLTTTATAAVPTAVTVATLRGAGYLPSSALDRNSFNQVACVLVLQPVANRLETLVVTEGGTTISDWHGPRIAAMMGARGGFITTAGQVQGTYGGWSRTLAPFNTANCSGTATAAGRLASALYFDNGQLLAPYLYRNQVPGYPEANTMHANIDMGGGDPVLANHHDLVNTKDIYAQRLLDADDNTYFLDPAATNSRVSDLYVASRSNAIPVSDLLPNHVDKFQAAATHGAVIPKPACLHGGVPHIYVIPAMAQVDLGTNSFRFAANDLGGSWSISITDATGVTPLPAGAALYRTSCYYN